jgi:PAS domain S-box-containing protein
MSMCLFVRPRRVDSGICAIVSAVNKNAPQAPGTSETFNIVSRTIEAVGAGLVILEIDRRTDARTVRYINQKGEQLLGYRRADLLGQVYAPADIEDPDPALLSRAFQRSDVGKLQKETVRIKRQDGAVLNLAVAMSRVAIDQELPTHIVFWLRELASHEGEANRNAQLEKLQAIGRMTSGVAHDFNNFLAVIRTNLEILAHQVDGRTKQLAMRALVGVERASGLTSSLLAYSRQQGLNQKRTDVSTIVDETRTLISRILKSDIRVEFRRNVPSIMALVDKTHLESCLLNLAINARDAMPCGGTLSFEIDVVRALPPGALTTTQTAHE